MIKKEKYGLFTLIGGILGAGILGLPYVIMKSGFLIGLTHIILIGIMICVVMLYLGEISLRTKKDHQLAGYAQKYIGNKGRKIMLFTVIFGLYSALLAYLIGEGQSLSYFFSGSSENSFILALSFWIILSILTFSGIKTIEKSEKVGVIGIMILIFSLLIIFWQKIDIENLSTFHLEDSFLPFGVVLFAFLGFTIIPEVREILKGKEKNMKKDILNAHIIVSLIYIVFTITILGSSGLKTPEIATLTLGKPIILLGFLTMFTAYLVHALALIDIFHFDMNLSRRKSWFYASIIPGIVFIILTLIKQVNFTKVLSIGGSISGGITAILILLMIKNAKLKGQRKPEYSMPYSKFLITLLIILFSIGTLTTIYNSIR